MDYKVEKYFKTEWNCPRGRQLEKRANKNASSLSLLIIHQIATHETQQRQR